MALDPYMACPCGSGKKFKWCCLPVHEEMQRALEQDAQGQHEAALRLMDQVIERHPNNPEVWGQKARLLFALERADDAEAALQRAFELNPNYAFGHYLQGRFRQFEGELPGALLLFRKAAELYDPSADWILAEIYAAIAETELKLNRPVAARAALKLAVRHDPNNAELRNALDQVFGEQSRFPLSARREYTFLGPPAGAPPERRSAWEKALAEGGTGKLGDAARAFEQLTITDDGDAAAWHNLALVRAWQGDNVRAVEALDRYVGLEQDEDKAAAAWALAEVLRCGHGMQEDSDHVEHSYLIPLRDPEALVKLLTDWERQRRLVGAQVSQESGMLTALVMRKVVGLTAEHAAAQAPRLACDLMMSGRMLRLAGTRQEAVAEVLQEVRERLGPALAEAEYRTMPSPFNDVVSEALVFPTAQLDEEAAKERVRQGMAQYFEETWIHQPRVALQGVPPVDAVGHPGLRKKLLGVLRFTEECAAASPFAYDFDRLRRKLGLLAGGNAPAPESGAADIAAMGAAELATLGVESLSDGQLEQAYDAARKLDAGELATRFASALVARPPRPESPDRFALFKRLIDGAVASGDLDAAMDRLNEGEKQDCERNEGRRRNDYELRRAQLHARRGEADAAHDVFERLIARSPDEMRYRVSAAEAMLSARQGARARKFAEEGLAKARQKNDRDSEQHFQELAADARKHGG